MPIGLSEAACNESVESLNLVLVIQPAHGNAPSLCGFASHVLPTIRMPAGIETISRATGDAKRQRLARRNADG